MSTSNRKEREIREREELILAVGRDLLLERGYLGMTMDKIAEATEYSKGLEYMMPVLFSLIFVGLENIQSHLENPFDQVGEDDVIINAEKFVERLASHPKDASRPIGEMQTQ